MDTTTELGFISDSPSIKMVNPEGWTPDLEAMLRYFLVQQPLSYEPMMSLDDVITKFRTGAWQAWAVLDQWNDKILAVGATSVTHIKGGEKKMSIELLAPIKNFFAVAPLYDEFEAYARRFGVTWIDTVAAPSLAKYLAKKHGYGSPGVYLRKNIALGRIN